jgi:hypothetical protein
VQVIELRNNNGDEAKELVKVVNVTLGNDDFDVRKQLKLTIFSVLILFHVVQQCR